MAEPTPSLMPELELKVACETLINEWLNKLKQRMTGSEPICVAVATQLPESETRLTWKAGAPPKREGMYLVLNSDNTILFVEVYTSCKNGFTVWTLGHDEGTHDLTGDYIQQYITKYYGPIPKP